MIIKNEQVELTSTNYHLKDVVFRAEKNVFTWEEVKESNKLGFSKDGIGLPYINGERTNFMITDLICVIHENRQKMNSIENIHEITSIYVEPKYRRMGIGTRAIKSFIEMYPNDLIVVSAGALQREYQNEPTNEQYQEILKMLWAFYETMSFVDINFLVEYENKIPFMYIGNNPGAIMVRYFLEENFKK